MRKKLAHVAFRTSLLYWFVSVIWILLSDRVLMALVHDPAVLGRLEIYKGWAFVTVTALLLWVVLRTQLRRWETEVAARRQAEQAGRASEVKFSRAFRASPVPLTITRLADHRFLEANEAFEKLSGYPAAELVGRTGAEMGLTVAPPEPLEQLELLRDTARKWELETDIRARHGEIRHVLLTTEVIALNGENCALTTTLDITERKRAEMLAAGNKQVLEMITRGAPLPATLDTLCRVVEAQSPGWLSSILLLDADGARLRHGAAPSLPEEYLKAVDGLLIGPCAGSCGTAAFRHERVLVADIANDPLWADHQHLALPHGLRACWSAPILDEQQRVLGTFALYFREPGLPQERHLRVIEIATHTAAICINRHHTEAAMRNANRSLRMLIDCNQTLVRATDEKSLLENICRIITGKGGYPMAWVGYLQDGDRRSLHQVAQAKSAPDQMQMLKPLAATREIEQLALENLLPVAGTENGGDLPHESCCSLPLKSEGRTFGALVVWSSEPGAFDPREMALLTELADDLAYGVLALRTQRAHQRSERELRLFRELMDRSTDAIFVVDPATNRILDANETACRQRGYSRAEFLRLKISDIADLAPEQFHWAAFVHRVQTAGSLVFEARDKRKDGTTFPVEVSVRHVEQDQSAYLIYTTRDVTERKHAEAAIEQRLKMEAQLSKLATTVPGVIHAFRQNPDGAMSLVYANHKIEEIYGLPAADLARNASLAHTMIHPDDLPHVETKIAESIQTMSPFWQEFRIRNPKRGDIWIELHSVPERESDGGILWHGFMQEITARRNADARQQTLEVQLRQAQKMEAIGQFAAGVAHDFNNILTVIQSYATLLVTTHADPAMVTESVQQISAAVKRAAGLTRQLLIFGRKQVIRPTTLDLNDVVSNITKMLRRIVGEDIVLQTDYASDLPMIHGDVGMLEQIILNLTVNSRDAMPGGGRINISTGAGFVDGEQARENPDATIGPYVYLSVSDTGSGIAPELLPHIFEPFLTTKEIGKGTGLGLATVYGIVQQHHGWITIKSEVSQGTTFRICFPPFEGARKESSDAQQFNQMPGGKETLLVVEDESPVRSIICHALQRCGYTIVQAASGTAALTVWRDHKDSIDLLLTDMVMPEGMSGHQLASRLLSEKPGLKVIYCSGYVADHGGKELTLTEGVNFLPKPFTLQALAQTVRDSLDRQELTLRN